MAEPKIVERAVVPPTKLGKFIETFRDVVGIERNRYPTVAFLRNAPQRTIETPPIKPADADAAAIPDNIEEGRNDSVRLHGILSRRPTLS